ncbi:MAG: hypothetical protein KDM63_21480 [Verrucomicrobiae bacterium]|nr:hypothetical protein [Verrucomicrobiae bacterium]
MRRKSSLDEAFYYVLTLGGKVWGGVLVYGSPIWLLMALLFFLVPKTKESAGIGESQAGFSKEQWEEIFMEAERFHLDHYQGETKRLAPIEAPKRLVDLGYDRAILAEDGLSFDFGNKYAPYAASVSVSFGSQRNPWRGVRYWGGGFDGEIDFRDLPHPNVSDSVSPGPGELPQPKESPATDPF